jgi:hypothetical protein
VTVVLAAILDQVWPVLIGSEAQVSERVLQEGNAPEQEKD